VVDRSLTPGETSHMIQALHERFGYPFTIEILYADKLERSKGGKYEDFMSEIE